MSNYLPFEGIDEGAGTFLVTSIVCAAILLLQLDVTVELLIISSLDFSSKMNIF